MRPLMYRIVYSSCGKYRDRKLTGLRTTYRKLVKIGKRSNLTALYTTNHLLCFVYCRYVGLSVHASVCPVHCGTRAHHRDEKPERDLTYHLTC